LANKALLFFNQIESIKKRIYSLLENESAHNHNATSSRKQYFVLKISHYLANNKISFSKEDFSISNNKVFLASFYAEKIESVQSKQIFNK